MTSDEAALVVAPYPADGPEAVALIVELDAEIQRRYPGAPVHGLTPADLRDPDMVFLIGRVDGSPAGCGALRTRGPGVGEVKRMYVRPEFRGRGVARAILTALEREAQHRRVARMLIETGDGQPEAIALYESAGYAPIPPYGEYVGNVVSRCFEKQMPDASLSR
jgi:GNAT superfamily N-acetyltransferase